MIQKDKIVTKVNLSDHVDYSRSECCCVITGKLKFHVKLMLSSPLVIKGDWTWLSFLCCSTFLLIGDCVLFCVRFSFFHAKTRDWLGGTSLKWPVLCWLGHKTTTQSISQFVGSWPLSITRQLLLVQLNQGNRRHPTPPRSNAEPWFT